MGMWTVPFGNVLRAHGYESIIGYAYACSAIAAFISPLTIGAMADQRVSPVRLLRWLSIGPAGCLVTAVHAIEKQWSPWMVRASVQGPGVCAAPSFGPATSVILPSLTDARREFGPIRA